MRKKIKISYGFRNNPNHKHTNKRNNFFQTTSLMKTENNRLKVKEITNNHSPIQLFSTRPSSYTMAPRNQSYISLSTTIEMLVTVTIHFLVRVYEACVSCPRASVQCPMPWSLMPHRVFGISRCLFTLPSRSQGHAAGRLKRTIHAVTYFFFVFVFIPFRQSFLVSLEEGRKNEK